MLPKVLLLFLIFSGAFSQDCPVDIPEAERRDCFPWDGASQDACEAQGCVWCPGQEGVPYCFFDDTVCVSGIAEADREDCHPEEGATKAECNRRGCIWCSAASPEVPFCFVDTRYSQGGDVCPVDIAATERIDCHPDPDATPERCVARGCYWCDEDFTPGVPLCFAPRQQGYVASSVVETPLGYQVALHRLRTPSWFGLDFHAVTLDIEFQTENRLRLKFSDANTTRWEPPVPIHGGGDEKPASTDYAVEITESPVFSIKVIRQSTGVVIFDTSIGGLQLSDQFLQIATYLDSAKLYGLGEHERQDFPHNMTWSKWGMWTRDQAVTESNLYGQQPFYMNVESDNNAHGVLFLNSNAQDVALMPEPALTFRTTGGVLDIYFFMGSQPNDVITQYLGAVGQPVMPPYWSLGFQLCRWGYENLDHMQAAVARMRQYDIPHDVQYGDIDYMQDYMDFTIDQDNFGGLPDYVQQLKEEGTRFVIILDPGISNQQAPGEYPPYDRGLQAGVWITEADGDTDYEGEVWPGLVYYPDFTKNATADWWVQECVLFKQQLDFAGLWIDMNEPSSFIDGREGGCSNTPWNEPMFLPAIADNLWKKTLCMEARQELGALYNTHSLYGWSMAIASRRAARESTGQRSITFSRSTFPGTGQYAQHWLGDNFAQWSNLRWSIAGMFEFNMFGMPYVGADICGFIGETSEQMCARWQQLGAFYPFSRNHNADGYPDQDPGMWESVGNIARETLQIRYTLLPYLYTLFHFAHTQGHTVIRPLMWEFVQDAETHSIADQFLWGSAFLISPVLDQDITEIRAYFPDAVWYNYYDGMAFDVKGDYATLTVPYDYIPLHVRGGSILPTQQPANSTLFSRLNPMGLIVALDDNATASGSFFWDDGDSLDTYESGDYLLWSFDALNGVLNGEVEFDGYAADLFWDDVSVWGSGSVSNVTVNGSPHDQWLYDPDVNVLTIAQLGLDMQVSFNIKWE